MTGSVFDEVVAADWHSKYLPMFLALARMKSVMTAFDATDSKYSIMTKSNFSLLEVNQLHANCSFIMLVMEVKYTLSKEAT